MICTPQFIQVYNETFKFIHKRLGREGLCEYWRRIADIILEDLKELIREKGLKGCVDYWSGVLTKENAHFRMTLNEKFVLEIFKCPSLELLKSPFAGYCEHCNVMYKKIFNDLGYKYEIKSGGGRCKITITKNCRRASQ